MDIIGLNTDSEGIISLTEAYNMPFKVREMFVKKFNNHMEEKNKSMNNSY